MELAERFEASLGNQVMIAINVSPSPQTPAMHLRSGSNKITMGKASAAEAAPLLESPSAPSEVRVEDNKDTPKKDTPNKDTQNNDTPNKQVRRRGVPLPGIEDAAKVKLNPHRDELAKAAPPAYTPRAYTPRAYTPRAYTPRAYTPRAYTPRAYCCSSSSSGVSWARDHYFNDSPGYRSSCCKIKSRNCRMIWAYVKYGVYVLYLLGSIVQVVYSYFLLSVATALVFYFDEKDEAKIIKNTHVDFALGTGTSDLYQHVILKEDIVVFKVILMTVLILYLGLSLLLCIGLCKRVPWMNIPYIVGGVIAVIVRVYYQSFPTANEYEVGLFWGIFTAYVVSLGILITSTCIVWKRHGWKG